jgi:hypothetical protein
MRRLHLAMTLALVAGCHSPAGTSIVVTVTGSPPAFDHLAITLTGGGRTRNETIAATSIPPDVVFGVDVPRSVQGPFHIQADAVDAGGTSLASDSKDVMLSPGQLERVTLTLGSNVVDDLSVPVDAGIDAPVQDDGPTMLPDLSNPPDLIPAVVALAGARPLPAVLATRQYVDLNGDGVLDILDSNTAAFYVFLNSGTGTFAPVVSHGSTNIQPPVDLNNDGFPDFVGFTVTGTVNVWLNNGKGVYPTTPSAYSASTTVSSVTITDFNKDGFRDLLCFLIDGTVDVFLNNKNGVFPATPNNYPVGTNLATVSDFTGDGAPELLFELSSANWVAYINDGSGGILSPTPSPEPSLNGATTGLTFKDLNGDKRVDAIWLNSNVSVMAALANADGTFAAATSYAITTVSGFQLADLNGDGKPDLVVTQGATATVSVLLNLGTGHFGTAAPLATGGVVSNLQLVDVTGDGKPEVLAWEAAGTGNLDVFINNGSGVFAMRVPYAVDSVPAFSDLDGDGDIDIIADTTAAGFSVLPNNGAGVFGPRTNTGAPVGPARFNDLDADGKLDAWGAGGANNTVWYSINNGKGVFPSPAPQADMFTLFTASAAPPVDLTGDGRADVLGSTSYIATVSGGLDLPTVKPTLVSTPTSIVIGDFKTDGHPDVVLTFGNTNIGTFVNNGDGTFQNESDSTVLSGTHAAAGHIKTPTSLDLVVSNGSNGGVSVLTGKGDGTFDQKVDYPFTGAPVPSALVLADLNHDNYDDLAVALSTGNIGVLLNNGNGILGVLNPFAGTGTTQVLAGNLNTDDRPDLVAVSSSGVSVLINDGTGQFPAKNDYTFTNTVYMARLFTQGTLPDLITSISSTANGMLTLRTNNGNGTYGSPTNLVEGQLFAFGDLNRDGRPDLVVSFGNIVRILIGSGGTTFTPAGDYYVPASTFLELVDLDGDGNAEVICGGGVGPRFVVLRNISR